jgi:hypothetical protein
MVKGPLYVTLRIYLGDGELHDRGAALLRRLSRKGALLAEISLARGALPVSSHLVGISLPLSGKKAIELLARPLRLEYASEGASLAVQFYESQRVATSRLCQALKAGSSRQKTGWAPHRVDVNSAL